MRLSQYSIGDLKNQFDPALAESGFNCLACTSPDNSFNSSASRIWVKGCDCLRSFNQPVIAVTKPQRDADEKL